jgi:hypothetical protein
VSEPEWKKVCVTAQHLNQICHKIVKIRVILWGYVPSASSCRLLRGRQFVRILLHAVLTVASYFLSLQHQQLIIFYKIAHKINNKSNGLRHAAGILMPMLTNHHHHPTRSSLTQTQDQEVGITTACCFHFGGYCKRSSPGHYVSPTSCMQRPLL